MIILLHKTHINCVLAINLTEVITKGLLTLFSAGFVTDIIIDCNIK